MKTIWKFQLSTIDVQFINMPIGAEMLSLQIQNNIPCIWCLVDKSKETEDIMFEIFGTGGSIHYDMGVERKYMGTYQNEMFGESFTWHLFERIN